MTGPSWDVKRARWSVAALFLCNGLIIGSWAAHIPLAKERLAIGHGALGLALLAMAVGALVSMPLSGPLIARFGSAAVMRFATVAFCLALPLPVLATDLTLLVAALFVFGAANGVMDVAMNAHGVAVERQLARPVMSSYHGMFSLGGLAGAALATLLLPFMPPALEAALLTATGLAIAAFTLPLLLPRDTDEHAGGPAFALPDRTSLALGALTFLALFSEGAVVDWSALHLQASHGIGPEYAAVGFAAFSGAMAAGRFSGDWARGRFGAVALVRSSAFLAAAGLMLSIAAPHPALAVAGFAISGIGLANLVPVLFGAAGALPGQSSGHAIAAVATMGYTGFLSGPPLIGFLAEAVGLAWALALMAPACAVIGIAASAASPAQGSRGGALPR